MKKIYIFGYLFLFGVFFVNAQDLIVLRDGNMIEARVQEISPAEIRYKRFDHLDGPTIVIPVANVLSIRYQNGRVETFGTAQVPAPESQTGQGILQSNLIEGVASHFGVPASLQETLNLLPAIRVAGRSLKFSFASETWTANVNGRPFSSGTVVLSNIDGGYVLTLKQTATYLRGRQMPSPELTMHLEYKPGPPFSFRVLTGSEIPSEIADSSDSQQDYQQAIDNANQQALAYFELGEEFRANGDIDQAIESYNEAIRLKNNFSEALFERGQLHYANKDYDMAIADYIEILKFDPEHELAINNIEAIQQEQIKIHFDLGMEYYSNKEYNRAIDEFNAVLKIDPFHDETRANLGAIRRELLQERITYYFELGMKHYNERNYKPAIEEFTEVLRLNPEYTDAYLMRARSYHNKKNYNRAISGYKNTLNLDPYNETAGENLAYIRNNYLPKLTGVGATIGTSFGGAQFAGTVRGVFAPFRYSFAEVGFEAGTGSGTSMVDFFSLYPYARYSFYYPVLDNIALYAGAGFGYMYLNFSFFNLTQTDGFLALEASAGVMFFNFIDVSYSIRTNTQFNTTVGKLSAGFIWRIR